MEDLISRTEFKEKLVDYNKHLLAREDKARAEEDYEELNAIRQESGAYFMLLSFLNNMPVAYSVEAVVAELEKQAKQYHRRAEEHKGYDAYNELFSGKALSYEHAIEIVRNGGKE